MKKRKTSIDLLKITLAIFVLLIHCNFLIDYNKALNFLTVQGLFRIAVPLFFIINGFYFEKIIDSKS